MRFRETLSAVLIGNGITMIIIFFGVIITKQFNHPNENLLQELLRTPVL